MKDERTKSNSRILRQETQGRNGQAIRGIEKILRRLGPQN